MYYQINFLEQTKHNLNLHRQGFVEGVLEIAELQNDYVPSPELPYQNNQIITSIYIDILEEVNWEDVIINNYSQLLSVANQCPAAGGKAVHRARSMLALINDSIIYNDDLACFQVGIYKEASIQKNKSQIQIIPNPAKDFIEIKLLFEYEGICNLKIINILGQTVLEEKINCDVNSHFIDVSKLSVGIFVVKFKVDNQVMDNQKVIIVR